MIKLIWLIASLTGAPLGVYVFPEPVTVDYCASRVTATEFVGDEEKIAGAISDGTKQDISITPTCLTEPEVGDLLKKLKTQGHDEDDTPAILVRDNGWEETPPKMRQWFQNLMQPDNPYLSCCGEADAYEADDYETEGDHYVAIITDTRGDVFPNGATRSHIEPGTRIPVPNPKMKWDAGNPTGHGIIFMGSGTTVYCYVTPGGV